MTTSGSVNVQQVQALAVQAMSVSIMASAIGTMVAASGTTAIKKKQPVPEKAVAELRMAFGSNVVDKAVEAVGTTDMLVLAGEIERLYIEDMKKRFGDWQTESALAAAPPGDLRTAREIAATLSGRGITAASSAKAVEKAVETGKLRGRQKAQPVLDSKTGIRYKSKSAAGMAVAGDYGLDPNNTFIWYEVIKRDPSRFKVL